MSLARSLFLSVGLLCSATIVAAEEEYEWQSERIHSDLPLYTFDWGDVWPRGYSDPEIIAGCESQVSFGDWRFTPNPDDEFGDSYWYRFSNYGAFHCAANFHKADSRNELDEGEFSRGLFVRMGTARHEGKPWELWALQVGFVPGSDYTLLARQAKDELVTRFTVLQHRCPRSQIREARGLDIWTSSYCAINSRRELLSFARRMLREPSLGTLELASNEAGSR